VRPEGLGKFKNSPHREETTDRVEYNYEDYYYLVTGPVTNKQQKQTP
jgi:hypothetical protein